MGFKEDLDNDLKDVFYDETEFADPAIYTDALGTINTISVMVATVEIEGALITVYQTPTSMSFSNKGTLTVGGLAHKIISADDFGGETTFILGDTL